MRRYYSYVQPLHPPDEDTHVIDPIPVKRDQEPPGESFVHEVQKWSCCLVCRALYKLHNISLPPCSEPLLS